MRVHHPRGFTLVELLVVIAIIGVMVAMAIPAVQASRETANRNLCRVRLAQLVLALQNYESAFESLPPGVVNPDGPIRNEAVGLHQSWTLRLLPYLDEGNAYRQIDFKASVYDPVNAPVRAHWPSVLVCPSDPEDGIGTSSYAGCHHDVEAPIAADNQGVLFLNSRICRDDVSDGCSHTIFVTEKRSEAGDLGWMSGTRATLRNTGLPLNSDRAMQAAAVTYVGGFASPHAGGANVALGDANVRFISEAIDPKVWQQLGNRADGSLLDHRVLD